MTPGQECPPAGERNQEHMLETRIMCVSMTVFHVDGLPIMTLYVIPIQK